MTDRSGQQTLTTRQAAVLLGSAVVIGVFIVLGAVLPAEYNRDPLGIGRAIGIDKLWAPAETKVATPQARSAATSRTEPLRAIEVEIPLAEGDDLGQGSSVEYKVRLKQGASYLYEWSVDGVSQPDELYSEFHGHTMADRNNMVVAEYRKAEGNADRGSLTAPFAGIHGWYFLNTSTRKLTVRLRIVGFFDVIAPGQPGNEAGLTARDIGKALAVPARSGQP